MRSDRAYEEAEPVLTLAIGFDLEACFEDIEDLITVSAV